MNDGGPAYPALDFIHSKDLPPEAVHRLGTTRGMTLADHFAGLAMAALIGKLGDNPFASSSELAARAKMIPAAAYQIATAMLAERDRLTNQGDTNAK